jgi:hypothetical protein
MAKKNSKATAVASGKSRGKRKLVDEQVMAIVSLYKGRGKGNPTMKDIAAQFSVSIGTISAIVAGRTYAWLTGISGPVAAAA